MNWVGVHANNVDGMHIFGMQHCDGYELHGKHILFRTSNLDISPLQSSEDEPVTIHMKTVKETK